MQRFGHILICSDAINVCGYTTKSLDFLLKHEEISGSCEMSVALIPALMYFSPLRWRIQLDEFTATEVTAALLLTLT